MELTDFRGTCKVFFYIISLYLFLTATKVAASALSQHSASPRLGWLERRDVKVNTPGIGVELEVRSIVFANENPKCDIPKNVGLADDDTIKRIKGAPISLVEDPNVGPSRNEWALTAEHSGLEDNIGIRMLVAEWIIDGTKVKLVQSPQGGRAKSVAKEIQAFTVSDARQLLFRRPMLPVIQPFHVHRGFALTAKDVCRESRRPAWA
jgi:hypothetical protein